MTDYDSWLDDPAQHVSVAAIFEHYDQTLAAARRVLDGLLRESLPQPEPEIRSALATALLTPETALGEVQREWLGVLKS